MFLDKKKFTKYAVVGALMMCSIAIFLSIKDEIEKGIEDAKLSYKKS